MDSFQEELNNPESKRFIIEFPEENSQSLLGRILIPVKGKCNIAWASLVPEEFKGPGILIFYSCRDSCIRGTFAKGSDVFLPPQNCLTK